MTGRTLILLAACCAWSGPDRGAWADAARGPAAEAPPAHAAQSPTRPKRVSFTALGDVTGLRLSDRTVTYCDRRGARVGDLATGRQSSGNHPCRPPAEPNAACTGLGVAADVRSPRGQPDDVIDVGAQSYPLRGRVHDCAAAGTALVVGTGSTVSLIDTQRQVAATVSARGSDRVAIDSGWVAWVERGRVYAAPRSAFR